MTPAQYAFAKLIHPVTPEEFFRDYWEKKPLVVHRDDPDYYRDLLSFETVNHALTSLGHQHGEVFMGNHDADVKMADYAYENGFIDVARLYAMFAEGSSIALNNLHDRVGSLGNLCRSMEAELSIRFQTNIYFTPPDAQCFPPHYDTHCVFALQCEGQKRWRLYDFPVELPFHTQAFDPKRDPIGELTDEFVLKAGDFVYCPRGLGHDADTKGLDEPSLHITLGVLQKTWADLILEAVAQVTVEDPKLRQGLPIGFARPGFERQEARAVFDELVGRVTDRLDFDRAMDFFVDDVVVTRHPVLPGQFEQVMRLRDLKTTDVRASRRPNLLYRIEETEKNVRLHAYGRTFTMPIHAAEPMRHALEHDHWVIGSLPGDLDDAGKLVLVRRLVKEGLVMLD